MLGKPSLSVFRYVCLFVILLQINLFCRSNARNCRQDNIICCVLQIKMRKVIYFFSLSSLFPSYPFLLFKAVSLYEPKYSLKSSHFLLPHCNIKDKKMLVIYETHYSNPPQIPNFGFETKFSHFWSLKDMLVILSQSFFLGIKGFSTICKFRTDSQNFFTFYLLCYEKQYLIHFTFTIEKSIDSVWFFLLSSFQSNNFLGRGSQVIWCRL